MIVYDEVYGGIDIAVQLRRGRCHLLGGRIRLAYVSFQRILEIDQSFEAKCLDRTYHRRIGGSSLVGDFERGFTEDRVAMLIDIIGNAEKAGREGRAAIFQPLAEAIDTAGLLLDSGVVHDRRNTFIIHSC